MVTVRWLLVPTSNIRFAGYATNEDSVCLSFQVLQPLLIIILARHIKHGKHRQTPASDRTVRGVPSACLSARCHRIQLWLHRA